VFFVVLALYFGIPAVLSHEPSKRDLIGFILFGLFSGLAFLSKYHSLFLWFGVGLYILFYNRIWFRKSSFYIAILLTGLAMIPVFYWNMRNDFVSFSFHESRVGLFNSPVNFTSFLQFNAGQVFYQNPILFIVFISTLFSLFRNIRRMGDKERLLILLSLPLIIIFILFSLFQKTLPHWTGPAFIGLIILSSDWLRVRLRIKPTRVFLILLASNLLVLFLLLFAQLQINYGFPWHQATISDPRKTGSNDLTLEMYGWKQARIKFQDLLERKGIEAKDRAKVKIISNKWFPAAHLDFYIAHPLNIDLLVPGSLEQSHKYFWINKTRSINDTDIIFFITTSMQFFDPEKIIAGDGKIVSCDTIPIQRNGRTAKNVFIYYIKGPLKNMP
jgi:4-amino-4-deoxy-L-arabinose transferase-like glycosyltransferase